MKKDEIIELLKEQLRVANDTVSSLTTQVNELIERIKSLEELLVQKGIAIDKAIPAVGSQRKWGSPSGS